MTTSAEHLPKLHEATILELDAALRALGAGPVLHFSEGGRGRAFSAGGPPIWAVATTPLAGGTLYVTYGLSEAVDATRSGHAFELTVLVPGGRVEWPALLLRAIAHDMRASRRDRGPGEVMTFDVGIASAFAAEGARTLLPRTRMDSVMFVDDPLVPTHAGRHGTTRFVRIVGLYLEELRLLERWSTPGYVSALAARDPALWTDISRPSMTGDVGFVEQIERGSLLQGSSFEWVCAPGVDWTVVGDGFRLELSAEAMAVLRSMLPARLRFGRRLVLMNRDVTRTRCALFEPAEEARVRVDGDALIFEIDDVDAALARFVETFDPVRDR